MSQAAELHVRVVLRSVRKLADYMHDTNRQCAEILKDATGDARDHLKIHEGKAEAYREVLNHLQMLADLYKVDLSDTDTEVK